MISLTLMIIYIALIFLFMILFTYLHELGHKRELNRVGISTSIKFHILDNIKKTFKEFHPFAMISFDEEKFNKLDKNSKVNILLGGIKIDLIIISVLTFIVLIFYFACFLSNDITLFYSGFFFILVLITQILKFPFNIFPKNSDIGKLRKLIKTGKIGV